MIENLIAVMMAVIVGALGALVLARGFYIDFWMFMFCFIMAGCQYSLVKSVQPDAASPMHVSSYTLLLHFWIYDSLSTTWMYFAHILLGAACAVGLHVWLVMWRLWVRAPSKAPVVSLSKKLYPYCLLLVCSRNGFEREFTIEIK